MAWESAIWKSSSTQVKLILSLPHLLTPGYGQNWQVTHTKLRPGQGRMAELEGLGGRVRRRWDAL
jgi:hypothetical protein